MITIENFQIEFDDNIVNRGYKYYLDNAVASLVKQKNGKWKAFVQGTNGYRIYFTMANNEIEDWECSCPYDWGPVCKHVVAVLFELQHYYQSSNPEKIESQTNIIKRGSGDNQISKILEDLSYEELKNFVQFYSEENSEFKLEILSEFSARISSKNKSDYKQIVKSAYNSAMDEWGFIDYNSAFVAVKSAQNLLENARNGLEAGSLQKALEIAQAVLEESVAVINESDDSDGDIGNIIHESFEIIFQVSKQETNSKMRKDFFDWCIKESQKKQYADLDVADDLLDLSSYLIDNKKQENELLNVLDKLEGDLDEKFSDYSREKYAKIKLSLFKQRRSKKETQQFLESNTHFSSFRKELIEQAIRKKDYDTAKILALNGVDFDTKRHHFGTVYQWKEYLLKIAQLEKETKMVRKLSLELFSSRHFDIKYYRIWKNTFQGKEKDEQINRTINLYRKKDSFEALADILIEEKRFKELLEIVQQSPDIYNIGMYESYLKAQFSKELVKLYEQAVITFLERNTGRRFYREASRILQKMKKLGGKKTVMQLAETLRKQYPRRPALIDEIKGF